MIKRIIIVFTFLLFLVGCSENANTDNGFTDEILGKYQEYLQTSIIHEDTVEVERQEYEEILNFTYNYYNEVVEDKLISLYDEFTIAATVLKGDFNKDNTEDYLVYSTMRSSLYFNEVFVVTRENNELKVVPTEIENIECIGQEFVFDSENDLFVRTYYDEWTGTGSDFVSFYLAKNNEILSTETTVGLGGFSYSQEDTLVLSECLTEGEWDNFRNTTVVFDDDKNEIISFTTNEYILDKESTTYIVTELESDLKVEEQISVLENLLYKGSSFALNGIYNLLEENQELYDKVEYALFAQNKEYTVLPKDNPYRPEIFYSENLSELPQKENIKQIAQSLQRGEIIVDYWADVVEPNYDLESLRQELKSTVEIDKIVSDYGEPYEIYKYDISNDGIDEIIMFMAGGTMGNFYLAIVDLDKNGLVVDINYIFDLGYCQLYKLNGEYFLITDTYDFNDKKFTGWHVYLKDEKEEYSLIDFSLRMETAVEVDENYYESTTRQFETTMSKNNLDVYISESKYYYIENYKRYEHKSIGKELEDTSEVAGKFGHNIGIIGEVDFNDDGVLDYTNIFKFFPSNRMMYLCEFEVVDGKTGELVDFSDVSENLHLADVTLYNFNDKNYLILLYYDGYNYILKLAGINGTKAYLISETYLSVLNSIQVSSGEISTFNK